MTYTGGLSLAEYAVSSLLDPDSPTAQPAVEYRRGPDMGGGIGGLLYSLRGAVGGQRQAKFNLGNGRGDIVDFSFYFPVP